MKRSSDKESEDGHENVEKKTKKQKISLNKRMKDTLDSNDPIVLIDETGKKTEFRTQKEAAIYLEVSPASVSNVLRGINKTCGGYRLYCGNDFLKNDIVQVEKIFIHENISFKIIRSREYSLDYKDVMVWYYDIEKAKKMNISINELISATKTFKEPPKIKDYPLEMSNIHLVYEWVFEHNQKEGIEMNILSESNNYISKSTNQKNKNSEDDEDEDIENESIVTRNEHQRTPIKHYATRCNKKKKIQDKDVNISFSSKNSKKQKIMKSNKKSISKKNTKKKKIRVKLKKVFNSLQIEFIIMNLIIFLMKMV